jgi:pimeloyl-ACP methyl ester carboxylesterase
MLLLALPVAASLPTAPATRVVAFKQFTYSASVVPASGDAKLPPLVLLPPIGVGIDRTFCSRLISEWAAQEAPSAALHAIDVVGMGDSAPKPKMRRSLTGGWDVPPRTPREWAEQVVSYVRDELGEPAVVIGQSNLCAVALEAASLDPEAVCGVVLVGPPAVEALSIDKPAESIAKVWKVTGTPIGAALFRFARRKPFLASFSKKNLFADPELVDDDYLDICAAGARDADTRHAIFSFVAGTWRQDYRPTLAALELPTLVVSGRDVGASAAAGGGVGKAAPPPPPPASTVDRTSFAGLLRWFAVFRRGRNQKAGEFAQVGRDLGLNPAAKLADFVSAMPAASAADAVETALLPGWNVLVYESPSELASCLQGFVAKRFAAGSGARAALPAPPQPTAALLKARIFAMARRTLGGANTAPDEGVEMERLVSMLEALSPTADAASSALLDGEWDQVYTTNPGGSPIVYADGRTARRKLGPTSGRLTQLVEVAGGAGSYRQRVTALGGAVRAELLADVSVVAPDAWDVAFNSFTLSAARLPLRRKSASGYTGTWTHTYLDDDTRVMRTRRADGGGEFLFVLRRK